MTFSKKINKVLKKTILFSTLALIIINLILIHYSNNKSSVFTCKTHYIKTIDSINGFTHMLTEVADRVATDTVIIELLNKNRNLEVFSEEEKLKLMHEVDLFEGSLSTINFIKIVSIANTPGKYLYSNGNFYDNFNIMERPWFKDEYLNPNIDFVVTDIHKDFNTGLYTFSVIKFIYSENEPLMSVILDINVEEFLATINDEFYLGDLNTYIKLENGFYLSSNGVVHLDDIKSSNNIVFEKRALDNKFTFTFTFNAKSLVYNKVMLKVNKSISIILIIVGIISATIQIHFVKTSFKPILASLDKLKVLLNNLENNYFDLDAADELQQLEFISESLSKSFDKKIKSLIYYDDLTKLPNRKKLLHISNELIKQNKAFALIFIDLNNFKSINDTFGHSTGDSLLASFSHSLEDIFTDKGIVTRYSGDEFVIIYNTYVNDGELLNFYDSVILERFKKPVYFNNTNAVVQFSAGVAVYPRDGKKFDELIMKSDFMMYHNKKDRQTNELLFFNNQLYNSIHRVEEIKLHLKTAVEKGELILYYQPIINKDKDIKKVEALIRWQNEKLGFVSPDDFIHYAEEIGEIVPIGYWVIDNVCKNFSTILKNNVDLQISINVSPIQLMELDFVDNVKRIIESYAINFSNICFEITESVVLEESLIVYDNIHSLHDLGINIALDDFGTGYASFSYLSKYKLDILKIDKIFVSNSDIKHYSIVDNIKNIAHTLDMSVVIEGVETAEQFYILAGIGCDYFQGYYFSKPLTLEDLQNKLLTQYESLEE